MEDLTKVKKFQKWVVETATDGSRLEDEVLVGSTAAFVILAILFFNVFWVLAVMFGAMLAYRALRHLLYRRGYGELSEREQFDWAMEEKRRIWADEQLPEDQKKLLSGYIDQQLRIIDTVVVERPQLTEGNSKPIKSIEGLKSSQQPQLVERIDSNGESGSDSQ